MLALKTFRDTAEGFEPAHPLLADASARHPGLRVPRTGRVFEALVPAVLEQIGSWSAQRRHASR